MPDFGFLEDFSTPESVRAPTSGPEDTPEYALGYAAAMAEENDRRVENTTAFLDQITEMAFTYAEAQEAVTSSLKPLFEAIIEQLIPALSQTGFASTIAENLRVIAVEDAGTFPNVSVHSASEAALRDAISDLGEIEVRIRPDDRLNPHEAIIGANGTETSIDTAEIARRVGVELQQLVAKSDKDIKHG